MSSPPNQQIHTICDCYDFFTVFVHILYYTIQYSWGTVILYVYLLLMYVFIPFNIDNHHLIERLVHETNSIQNREITVESPI